MSTLYEKLSAAQSKINVPKGQTNTFGNYKYRSCEDILTKAKPICIDNGLILTIFDSMELLGDRFYIKATARITEIETGEEIEVSAFARESLSRKGQDDSQITGTASSYARKYALNGLFLLDDTKDADSDEYHEETNAKKSTPPPITYINDSELKELKELCIMAERTEEYIAEAMKVKSLQNIQSTQFGSVKAGLLKIINANKEKENS